jgi:murein DD-endopeptidase MepM/ murein hydrolase activator NlpD
LSIGILAFCAVLAAQTNTPASSPSTGKTATPKAKAKSKAKARVTRKPKPLPPPAEIPAVVESASIWRGCLEPQGLPKLASGLGMEQTQLTAMLEEKGLPVNQDGGCIAYVAATGGEAGVASAVFQYSEPTGESRTVAFHKTGDETIVTPAVCDCGDTAHRVLTMPAGEIPSSIAPNLSWQLGILVPHMLKDESSEASLNYTVRAVVGRRSEDAPERLESVEIFEKGSGKRVNGAWWLDRGDGPGVMVGMDGVAYERLLWDSPVKYSRSARGVGASTTTLRRRVPAKKGAAKTTVVRTVQVPGYHLGIDMTAAKGTDVHAVGDAKVAFAGRRGAFGNLIILDHGRGYETYYAHLSKIVKGIKAGTPVSRGDVIGLVGSTGRSTGAHLHFETRLDTHYLDPFDESRQLGFWLLTGDEQERLAMQLLTETSVATDEDLLRRH